MKPTYPVTLVVEFESETFHVDASAIARDRAEHYADDDPDLTEYNYTLGDNSELIDWASNNMNWEDLAPHAVRVQRPPEMPDYDAEWGNATKRVVRQ